MQQTSPIEAGLTVIDLDRMLDFYTGALGCEEQRRADIPAELSSSLGLANDGYTCVWLATPVGERIKLMRPPTPPAEASPPQHLLTLPGLAYLTFYCSDLAATLEAAERQGARLRSDRALLAADRPVRLCFFEDPEGNVIELVETPDGQRV